MSVLSTTTETPALPNQREPNVDIIYHNMNSSSDFKTFRAGSDRPVEQELLRVAKHIDNNCYKIVSISASKYSLVVVFSTELSKAQLREKGFPFPRFESNGEH